jgi:dolichol-phosphate mannosyltransferase
MVIPVYNEEKQVRETVRVIGEILTKSQANYEFIFIDDGSKDQTWRELKQLAALDPNIQAIKLSRNFGKESALCAGLEAVQGDACIVMDADLQDPPEVLLRMIEKWREGYDVAYAVRTKRVGETKFKLWTASAFYRLIRYIADVDIPLDAGDFRLMDRKVVLAMRQLREKNRFMRGLSSWVGYKQVAVEYERAARYAGETKYPLRKMLRLANNAITSFSHVPLQLAMYTGFFFAGLAGLGIVIAVVLRIFGHDTLTGQATTLVSVLFLGGVQLIFLGIIGEYLGRIYDEVKDRPLYLIADAYGFEAANATNVPQLNAPRPTHGDRQVAPHHAQSE